jgi:hypothetical protein
MTNLDPGGCLSARTARDANPDTRDLGVVALKLLHERKALPRAMTVSGITTCRRW